jgi:hypothetical protein
MKKETPLNGPLKVVAHLQKAANGSAPGITSHYGAKHWDIEQRDIGHWNTEKSQPAGVKVGKRSDSLVAGLSCIRAYTTVRHLGRLRAAF